MEPMNLEPDELAYELHIRGLALAANYRSKCSALRKALEAEKDGISTAPISSSHDPNKELRVIQEKISEIEKRLEGDDSLLLEDMRKIETKVVHVLHRLNRIAEKVQPDIWKKIWRDLGKADRQRQRVERHVIDKLWVTRGAKPKNFANGGSGGFESRLNFINFDSSMATNTDDVVSSRNPRVSQTLLPFTEQREKTLTRNSPELTEERLDWSRLNQAGTPVYSELSVSQTTENSENGAAFNRQEKLSETNPFRAGWGSDTKKKVDGLEKNVASNPVGQIDLDKNVESHEWWDPYDFQLFPGVNPESSAERIDPKISRTVEKIPKSPTAGCGLQHGSNIRINDHAEGQNLQEAWSEDLINKKTAAKSNSHANVSQLADTNRCSGLFFHDHNYFGQPWSNGYNFNPALEGQQFSQANYRGVNKQLSRSTVFQHGVLPQTQYCRNTNPQLNYHPPETQFGDQNLDADRENNSQHPNERVDPWDHVPLVKPESYRRRSIQPRYQFAQRFDTGVNQQTQPRNHTYFREGEGRSRQADVSRWKIAYQGPDAGLSLNDFLSQAEDFAKGAGMQPVELRDSLIHLLEGQALIWFRAFGRNYKSWPELKSAMREEFLPPDYDFFLRQDIERRYQGEREPFTHFVACMEMMFRNFSFQVSEYQKLEAILRNMNPELGKQIAMYKVRSIKQLSNIVKSWERYQLLTQRRTETKPVEPAYVTPHLPAANQFRPRRRVFEIELSDEGSGDE